MEYYFDLFRRNKRTKLQLIFSILSILISLLWITNRIFHHQHIIFFDWLYSFFFFFSGVINLLEYFGKPIDRIFGTTFIKINNREISYKPGLFKNEISLEWKDIETIIFKINYFEIIYKHAPIHLKYHGQEYAVIQELKNAVKTIAQGKAIPIQNY